MLIRDVAVEVGLDRIPRGDDVAVIVVILGEGDGGGVVEVHW